MQIRRKSAKLTASILLVLLMASVMLMASVSVKAQEGSHGGTPDTGYTFSTTVPAGVTVNWTFHPVVYLSFTPNPVGVGQSILVNMWTTPPPAADRYLQGFTVTITKPNNETDIVGPMNSYVADGTAWFEYVVDQVGTWKLKFSFPDNTSQEADTLTEFPQLPAVQDMTQCITRPPPLQNKNLSYRTNKCFLGLLRYQPTTGRDQSH